jgi:hypothetical protein
MLYNSKQRVQVATSTILDNPNTKGRTILKDMNTPRRNEVNQQKQDQRVHQKQDRGTMT